jgi:hypothetical protein
MKNLCQAIIWSACFLELSPDDIIDPDSAVKALEDIASALQAATEEEKEAFRQACFEEALLLEKDAGPKYATRAEFIRSLPESSGI